MLIWCSISLLFALCVPVKSDTINEDNCYGPGDVAGTAVASIVLTLAILVGSVAFYRWRKTRSDDDRSVQKTPLEDGSQPEGAFAFDNPYFREDDVNEKGRGNEETTNGGLRNGKTKAKISNASTAPTTTIPNGAKNNKVKSRLSVVANPFQGVFSQHKKQTRTMDDSCINSLEPERTVVPLKGHDFTGLGFNICGNMRDGIFVKDVLHRGPASESGQIKAGDRIVSVTVSFSKMVYEDALTILSYASPYDVQMELEKANDNRKGAQGALVGGVQPPGANPLLPGQSKHKLGSSSFSAGGQRLFHPLYRSQSIDDLTQIGNPAEKSDTPAGSPKRSKSVGLSVLHQRSKSTTVSKQTNELSLSTSPVPLSIANGPGMPVTGSLNERTLASAMLDGKRALESLKEEATPNGGQKQALDKLWPQPPVSSSNAQEPTQEEVKEEIQTTEEAKPDVQTQPQSLSSMDDQDVEDSSLSRRTKRKAPAPPPHLTPTPPLSLQPIVSSTPKPNLETKAQIHKLERQKRQEEDSNKGDSDVSSDSLEENVFKPEDDVTLTVMTSSPPVSSLVGLEPVGKLWLDAPPSPTKGEPKKPARKGRQKSQSEASSDSDDQLKTVPQTQKEVIEIPESELDGVMMSHRQFLLEQAKATGIYTHLRPDPKAINNSIGFEAWSFADQSNNSDESLLTSSIEESKISHYQTAVQDDTIDDIPPLIKTLPPIANDSAESFGQVSLNKD